MYMMENDIERVLLTQDKLKKIVEDLGERISKDYEGKQLILVSVLKGSVVFMGDLMKHVTLPVEIDFMKVSSYGRSTSSSGTINIILDLNRRDISQLDVLIIEDIIDSGRTLSYLCEYLKLKGANSVRTCTLLDKPSRREVDFTPDYVGLEIPDEFVVGYGLDYAEQYRTLPYVGILKPQVYEG